MLRQGVFLSLCTLTYSNYVIPLKFYTWLLIVMQYLCNCYFVQVVHVTAGLAFTGAGIHTAPVHIGDLHNYYAICL